MQIDLRTVAIEPLRLTFDHIARRLGPDRQPSRYQEGTLDIQPCDNLQYRPTWDPARQLYDPARTRIVMRDWYAFKDPRQYYYGAWTMARARQQEAVESSFALFESRDLGSLIPAETRHTALQLLLPLRHVAYAANLNNTAMCAYGYGTAVTQPCMFQAMDQLGIAQYLTQIGLLLGDSADLDDGRNRWLGDGRWQELRRLVENTLVQKDWFELLVAQNLVIDGLLYPLVYQQVIDKRLAAAGGVSLTVLTAFMNDWFSEAARWVDATIKTAAAESPANAALITAWIARWKQRASDALEPVAELALGESAASVMEHLNLALEARCARLGVPLAKEAA
ncbi:MAG: phenol hydroxylase [Pseudomonadota bacterium]|nr:phenol hydroxylase [Pseudomonadota bacterium]